jgi:hypothetical protein
MVISTMDMGGRVTNHSCLAIRTGRMRRNLERKLNSLSAAPLHCVSVTVPFVWTMRAVGIGTCVKLVSLLIVKSALPMKFNVSPI